MKKLFLFNILVIVFGLALVHADDSDAFSPYLDAAEHTISAQEYSDLKAYVERAQKILSNTLENSTAFSGAELHSHLLKGVELALRNTDLRGELLLFRYVLVRAVEVDRIYNDARTPTTTESEAAQLSSLVILIPAIESALSYYQTSDLPRLATTVVPSPNWQEFAADQVPHLLRAIDLAPSKTARAKMARTAVGWSAKALNSALERRTAETADLIVQLGELYNDPNLSHPTFVARAQETLLKVYKTFKKPLTTVAVAPATSGQELKIKSRSLPGHLLAAIKRLTGFPIVSLGSNESIGIDEYNNNDHTWNFVRATTSIGGGIGTDITNKSTELTTSRAFFVESDVIYGGNALSGPPRLDFTIGQAYGKVGLTLVPTGVVGNWQYSANAAVTGAFMGFLSGYLAVERNVFSNLEETFVRGGWAPQTMIRTGNKQYVFLRAWLGVSHFSCKRRGENNDFCYLDNSGNKNEPESDVSGGGILVYKGKRLSSELDISYSRGDLSEGGKYSRFNANGSVSLRLGILFNRDMLHLKGNAVDYSGDAPGNVSGHVFYGVTW